MDKFVIKRGMKALTALDRDIAGAVGQIGIPKPRLRPAGFETLFTTIVSQQISTEAAGAIVKRVRALMNQMTPRALLNINPEALRKAGMSYRKIDYARGLSEAIIEGRLDIDRMPDQTDEQVVSAITALHGFGVWSAEIYLMFSLRREDVFPAGDLALRISLGKLKGLDDKPTPKEARALVAHWSPWRSVGSLFLWHYYRGAPG
ncbi:MAG: DNA-3-methyladenine glycosylase 2 family protein [Gammaproteobacteria bacterium]|nr:DNA-3-methyladenine glycosylase 2 family protein [Gammaproteobacteria bacterium]